MKKISALLIASWAFIPGAGQAGTLQLTPSVALREEYSDNILFVSRDKQNDLISTISPQLEISEKKELLAINLTSRFDSINYTQNSDLNAFDYDHKCGIDYTLTPRVRFSGNIDSSQDSRPDRELQTSGVILNTSKRNNLNGSMGAQYGLTEKLTGLLSLAYAESDFADTNLVDSNIYNFAGSFSYNLGTYLPLTTAQLSLDHTRYEYTNGTKVLNYAPSIGISHDLSETYRVTMNIGPRLSHSIFSRGTNDDVGIGGDFSFEYRGERSKAKLTFSREEESISGSAGTAERSSFSLTAGRKIDKELSVGLALFYRNNKSKSAIPGFQIDEEYLSFGPNLTYKITPDIILQGTYQYDELQQKSIIGSDAKADRNQMWLRLNFQYPLLD